MKKFILAMGAAAMMLGVTSCGGSSSKGADSFSDSLSVSLGEFQGSRLLSDYNTLPDDQKARMAKEELMKGFKQICMADTNQQAYITGLQIGMQLYGQLMRYEQAGIKIDRKKVYDAYAKAFMADSVSATDMEQMQLNFQKVMGQADQKMQEYYKQQQEAAAKAKMESPEAKKNIADGKAYIEKLRKADPSIQVTPSGLAYKVVEEGQGEPVGQNGSAKVQYKGTLTDGTVFDENQEGVTFRPNMVIPGFGEGLAKMKKGSHYIFYIPGDQAYGAEGTPDGKIGPMATLTFDVKTVDVTPATKKEVEPAK